MHKQHVHTYTDRWNVFFTQRYIFCSVVFRIFINSLEDDNKTKINKKYFKEILFSHPKKYLMEVTT